MQIIDRKIIQTERTIDPDTGLIEYRLPVKASNKYDFAQPVFATYEHEPVVFQERILTRLLNLSLIRSVQIGTSDSSRALAAAEHVANDVKAIDINMGCITSTAHSIH